MSVLSSSSFLFFLSLLAWLPFCCVAATQQPSNPTSQQHNNPTTQQPNNPTTQQTTQQHNNPANKKQLNHPTTQQQPNHPQPLPKKLPAKPFFVQIGCLFVSFFFASSFSRFFTILNHFGRLWGAFGALWGLILGLKIDKNGIRDAKCSQFGSKRGLTQW